MLISPRAGRLLAAVGLAAVGVGCSYTSPNASEFACVYKGGPLDSKGFEKAVEPGAGRTGINLFGSTVLVPTRVAQYDNSDGLPPVTVTVRGVPLTFSPSLTFTISSVPVPVPGGDEGETKPAGCELVEQHLRPLGATDFNDDVADSSWVREFLNVRVGPVVRDVAPRVLQGQDPTAVALNIDGARDTAAETFGTKLTETLGQQLGGDYFCAPTYRYGQPAEECGTISVVLPEPTMSDEDRALIAAPQRARTEANNQIAVATEEARAANETAAQLEQQATSAEQAADARELIAEQEGRVAAADASNRYAWCEYLVTLGQDCALVRAAEEGNFPTVFTPTPVEPVVAVDAEG